ncbi:Mobile element protein [Fimbriiglobus ruber]|uniref:Mobile element protein n=2 Tax=Fimbriiglobus ruber TaxID=1908690 RepID=A0A225DGB1_9BACT|nr:Mobile element protein [Fimbriiglobus ruber]
MRDRVQQIVVAEHFLHPTIGLIDETSFAKKGDQSPGVQRQWCGHLGKVENGVVTVHLGIASGDFPCLLDADLFRPQSWDDDRKRCQAAVIPDDIVYRPKWRIAVEHYDRAVAHGLRFDWLTFDEGYGRKPEFLRERTARGQQWVVEVPKNEYGWRTKPRVTNREDRSGGRGRPRKAPRLVSGQRPARRLDEMLTRDAKLRDQDWVSFRLDDRDHGPSVWEVKRVTFYPTQTEGLPAEPLQLVVARHTLDPGGRKFFLSNAPAGTSTATLLRVALTRHRVEQCFRVQKSELGMDHFEMRNDVGRMRHLHLTAVRPLFLMRAVERRRGEKSGLDGGAGPHGDHGSTHGPAANGSGVEKKYWRRWSRKSNTTRKGTRNRGDPMPNKQGSVSEGRASS